MRILSAVRKKGIVFMKEQEIGKRYINCIIVMVTILVNVLIIGVRYDFYYALNDDVFMRDIMSGAYTGTPDGHNVQTLYVLGAFISLFYKLFRAFPWYGVFLFACQTVSLYLIGVRLLKFCGKLREKAGCMVLLTLFIWGVILPHMTALHYTFISAVLAAAAIFLFMTTPAGLPAGQFIVRNIPSVLLVILAYQLRTEMLLLLFPLIGLAGLFRWSEEEQFFQKENTIKYGIVLCCIIGGMLLSRMIDFAAYGSGAWKEFLAFFDKRTEVYDYHLDVVTDGKHGKALGALGLSDAQQELLANYNFGLDESIDAELMGEIAAYAGADADYAGTVPECVRNYLYRTLHDEDAPYNRLVIFLYFMAALTGICAAATEKGRRKRWSFIWKLLLLGACRTSLWMFILIKGRYPERITHSLYFAEAVLLLGMLCVQLAGWRRINPGVFGEPGIAPEEACDAGRQAWSRFGVGKGIAWIAGILASLLCAFALPQSIGRTGAEEAERTAAYQDAMEVARYCREHPENFYFEDVYSTVSFTRKIFQDGDNALANFDIMGGWLCKSPLYYEKLRQFGMETMEEGLVSRDAVYFIAEKDGGTDWLTAYYAGKGITVSTEQVDLIADTYAVYRIKQLLN